MNCALEATTPLKSTTNSIAFCVISMKFVAVAAATIGDATNSKEVSIEPVALG
jgi:hypothetical protein